MISKDSYKILKLFNKNYSLTDDEIKNLPDDAFSALIDSNYIKRDSLGYPNGYQAEYSDYHITDQGKAYVQSKSKSEWWSNNWIGIVGMIFAFISAFTGIISLLLQLNLL
jgi:hypothetical protein|uniref:Uncharacterized protein n=1 Tax=Myoviridae sp. ctzc413 TaxID=2826721 RepID=A0A8S5NTE4_9CAUD|nr:MAG TPA: protein of unknown function DUF2513 [Myoviridae sp. ctzc413]